MHMSKIFFEPFNTPAPYGGAKYWEEGALFQFTANDQTMPQLLKSGIEPVSYVVKDVRTENRTVTLQRYENGKIVGTTLTLPVEKIEPFAQWRALFANVPQ